ncbi:MAG: ATP-binding protein [Planctomycetota bacterium]
MPAGESSPTPEGEDESAGAEHGAQDEPRAPVPTGGSSDTPPDDATSEFTGVDLHRTVLSASLDPVCVLDVEEHTLVDCNDAFADLVGSSRGAAIARRIAPLQLMRGTQDLGFEGLRDAAGWRGEGRLVRHDGSTTYVEVGVHRVGGRRSLDYCFVRDRSKARLGELRDRDHQEALAQVSRLSTLGEMAAGIAHEFNQPLAAIVNYANGCARMLEQRGEGDETVFRGLRAIAEQGRRASEVIRRLRTFTRRAEQNREPFLVSDLVTDALDLSSQRFVRAKVDVSTRFRTDDERVVVDGIQIEQVLMNLLLNATEALVGSPDPRLRVETEAVRVPGAPGFVSVTVADTGAGVPEEGQNRVFEPFYSDSGARLGLGLTIAQSIVEAHGGRLWLERDAAEIPPGFRTAFRFTLPRRNAPMGP